MTTNEDASRIMEYHGWLRPVEDLPTFDPFLNLDREARYMKAVKLPSYRIWRSNDSVVLGRFLQPNAEVRLSRAADLGVPILRRPSGGGAVFHDLGNVNYSIYLPQGRMQGFSIEESLLALSFPITALLDSIGVPWSWEPPNNVCVLGRKISGSAQARSGGRLLHHGTLLVSTDLDRMCQLLKPGGRSRIAPVVNLSEIVSGIMVKQAEAMMARTLNKMIVEPPQFDIAYAT